MEEERGEIIRSIRETRDGNSGGKYDQNTYTYENVVIKSITYT